MSNSENNGLEFYEAVSVQCQDDGTVTDALNAAQLATQLEVMKMDSESLNEVFMCV